MLLTNYLLSSPVPSAVTVLQQYINLLQCVKTTRSIQRREKIELVAKAPYNQLDTIVDVEWERIDAILVDTFIFPEYQLRQYETKKANIQPIDDELLMNTLETELHENFIYEFFL